MSGASSARFSLKSTLLSVIGLLTVIVCSFAFYQGYGQLKRVHAIQDLQRATHICDRLFDVSQKIAAEREVTFALLHATEPDVAGRLVTIMGKARAAVDGGFSAVAAEFVKSQLEDFGSGTTAYQPILDALKAARKSVDVLVATGAAPPEEEAKKWFDSSTKLITDVNIIWMSLLGKHMDVDTVSVLQMRLKYQLGMIMEYTGRERSIIGGLIVGARPVASSDQARLLRWQGTADMAWSLSETLTSLSGLAGPISPYLKEARSHYTNGHNMVQEIFYVPGYEPQPPYPIAIDLWIELSQEQIESLYDLKNAVLVETQRHGDALIAGAHKLIMLQMVFAVAALSICAFIFFFIGRSVMLPLQRIVEELQHVMSGRFVQQTPLPGSKFREIDTLLRALQSYQEKAGEIERANQSLARHAAQLERTNVELDQFAYVASHDLKAPLRGIDNLAMWVEEDAGDALPESARGHLKMLRGRVSRLESLLMGILSYSRAGRVAEEMVEINTQVVVRNIADMWVSSKFSVTIGDLPVIRAPKTAFEQIIGNLLSNAAKHHDRQTGKISVMAVSEGKGWIFEIADDGPGIPAEYAQKVFEMFHTLKPRDVVEGSGMGMAIAKKLVTSIGGRIWVKEGMAERGTTICLWWPKA